MRRVIYPIHKLLGNQNFFYAISEQLGNIIEPSELYEYFWEVYSVAMEGEEIDPEMIPDKVCFESQVSEDETEFSINIILNNGVSMTLDGKGFRALTGLSTEKELQKAGLIYHKIVETLERELPEHVGNIDLVESPTPDNNFLQEAGGEDAISGEGRFLSDPDRTFRFRILYNPVTEKSDIKIFQDS
ncbi:hypothetical protein SCBWM1_gp75 [Synechococcus phage S-CBWM1]|uniref:Uncharacterized protein n=1 Tax=Synechococcus phage S-CBWM1 TaxID=2053653 RepID=A0A3G1L3K7_9CAUD|nr:hypothetical protein HOU61_gp122 [Synechococcus phage S-CBWM1]ATW62759.1 hypothetical protein SCBWM1_gp75 [Synechococcus phage S-CBWM1]